MFLTIVYKNCFCRMFLRVSARDMKRKFTKWKWDSMTLAWKNDVEWKDGNFSRKWGHRYKAQWGDGSRQWYQPFCCVDQDHSISVRDHLYETNPKKAFIRSSASSFFNFFFFLQFCFFNDFDNLTQRFITKWGWGWVLSGVR